MPCDNSHSNKTALMHRRAFVALSALATASMAVPALASEPESYFPSQQAQRLTLDDLIARNDGNPDFAYVANDEGCLTWVRGSFYDGTVADIEGVMGAIDALADLLGITPQTELTKGPRLTDDNGHLYFIMKQVHQGVAVENASVKVIVDTEGRAVALSSSLVPGVEGEAEAALDEQGAIEAVQAYVELNEPELDYTFYTQHVDRSMVMHPDTGQTALTYVVYSNNPDFSVEGSDLRYAAHYIGGDGTYFYRLPVASMGGEAALEGSNAASYFEGKEQAVYSGEVELFSGEKTAVEVPVLYDAQAGMYYLADAQRKIAVMQMWDFEYNNGAVELISSPDNKTWDQSALATYNTYLKVYDFYAAIGWKSCDALETPIAILANYCDEEGNLQDSPCYTGLRYGWHCFGASALSAYGECVDVCAHEYAHSVTFAAMTNIFYQGESGAINEAFADILGNICEMLTGSTNDTEWYVGERSDPVRCMSNPSLFGQPEWVGDTYYVQAKAEPSPLNDNGGVHINNSLLASVAVDLDRAGMSLEEQRVLWTTTAFALTPTQGFRDVASILLYAADASGLFAHKDAVAAAIERIGLSGDLAHTQWRLRDGCGLARFNVAPSERYVACAATVIPADTFQPGVKWATGPDAEGVVEMQFAAGDYVIAIQGIDMETPAAFKGVYTQNGWLIGDIEYSEGTVVTIPQNGTVNLGTVGWM